MDIQHGKYVAFAGGSGITPIISIIESTLLNEPLSQFQLFYANKRSDNIIFKDRLEAIKNKFFDRFTVHYFFSQEEQESPLFQGRLDKEKCLKLNTVFYKPLEVNEYFLCGPFGMVEQVKEALLESGVKKEKIKFELFTNPGQDTSKEVEFPELHSETDFKSMSDIQVVMDSDTYSFSLNYYESNIIDEGIKKGYDFPYSCKGGVCSTCKAKVIEGEVKMDVCYALEDDEIENGYFLACQAHPRSKKLKISFDE